MPMILLNIPNKTHPLLSSTPKSNQAPDKTTRLDYTALHVLLHGLNGYRFADGDASELEFMQRWPDIFAWCSLLSDNYLERPNYFLEQGDDFKEELELLLTLPASGVVSVVTTTAECISLIARLYLLAARMSLTTEESLLFAGRALQNLLQLPQSAWDPEFTNVLDKTHPGIVNGILYRIIKDTERRPMNCAALKDGFIILSNICRAPVRNRMLIRKDAVYWICRATHKLVVNSAMVEKENIKMVTGTIKMGCHYLLEANSQQTRI
ncbi:hypothetical protein EV368DRAFT_88195 [Lentinula lateritia]|nr:hypothetical protein EV368DRAFT_88195 [Lentinula lateritia]